MGRLKPDLAEQARAHKDAAVDLTASGELGAAISEYLASLELAPDDVFARQRAAELLARLGQTARAIEQYLCLVGKYAAEGRLLKAIATSQLILKLDPSHAETSAMLADLLAERRLDASARDPSIPSGAMRRPSQHPPPIDPAMLARIPLFAELAREPLPTLLRKFERVVARPGELIFDEGRTGDACFAIVQGVVRVERRKESGHRDPYAIAELGQGEFFGEMSLLTNCPRFASAVAGKDCELLRVGRQELDEIVIEHPRVGEELRRVHKLRLAANIARSSAIFAMLPPESQAKVVDLLRIDVHAPRTMLLRQGRPGMEGLFFLVRGECDVFHRRAAGVDDPCAPMIEGDVFGEVSLLQGGPPVACVRTAARSVVLRLHRAWVEELMLSHPPVRDALYALAARRLERSAEMRAREAAGAPV